MKANLFTNRQHDMSLSGLENLQWNNFSQRLQSFVNLFNCKGMQLLLFSMCFSLIVNAQVTKSVEVTPGSLSSVLTASELTTITNLTLTGTMDARDFKTMRDLMPALAVLDLSGGTIVVYNGTGGTKPSLSSSNNYPANVIPDYAFFNQDLYQSKTRLVTVVIPSSVISIGNSAFGSCTGLITIALPSLLTSIGSDAFSFCSGLTSLTIPSSVKSIGGYAFYSCSRLTSITIPPSVTTIGSFAFYYCMKLTSPGFGRARLRRVIQA